jgi:predicted CXXCH cytochrome family protein
MNDRAGARLTMLLAAGGVGAGLAAGAALAQQSVVDTVHNLSASGPGVVRATVEEQVCIFCHATHDASPVQPLWNRQVPTSAYDIYTSSSLDAQPGQPTGSSKLCLSCHDGTIALGSVVSEAQIIQMAGGITTIPAGGSNLGTDLSDDHPVSFRYDGALAGQDTELVDPAILPPRVRLDSQQELQCTTCHDAHDDSYGDFLVMSNAGSALCVTCHQLGMTTVDAHQDCTTCHMSHTAPSGPFLLRADRISTSCLDCHDGSVPGAADILADLSGFSVHDTNRPIDPPDPIPGHVTCSDCHEPHTMETGLASAPDLQPTLGRVSGVSAAGSVIERADFEYEVCYKCHAEQNALRASWVPRRITQINTRLEFDPSAVSYHPVVVSGKNQDVPSLRPPWTTASMVYCSDCHGSERSVLAGGSGPNGVHGSIEPPLLVARYVTDDFTPESQSSYALCYRCHERDGPDGILNDRSFPHQEHVVDEQTPCSACHDAHGISSAQGTPSRNSHLINFDSTIVFPHPLTGELEFRDTGTFSGMCTLTCHGEVHDGESYSQ